MQMLGYEAEDLNTRKRKDYFREAAENEASATSPVKGQAYQAAMNLNTIMPEDVEEALVTLRYKHYQQRLMDRIMALAAISPIEGGGVHTIGSLFASPFFVIEALSEAVLCSAC